MLYSELLNLTYCFNCKEWIDELDIYQPDGFENEGRLCHLKCDSIVGYTWDPEWQMMLSKY